MILQNFCIPLPLHIQIFCSISLSYFIYLILLQTLKLTPEILDLIDYLMDKGLLYLKKYEEIIFHLGDNLINQGETEYKCYSRIIYFTLQKKELPTFVGTFYSNFVCHYGHSNSKFMKSDKCSFINCTSFTPILSHILYFDI